MATRSLIAKQNQDGTITSIYCHYDGYPSHNGIILQGYYDTPFKVEQLLALGDLSILGDEIGEQQKFDEPRLSRSWCLAYGRDRGEKHVEAKTYTHDKFFSTDHGVDYLYLYNNNEWECYNAWTLKPENIPAFVAA